MSMMLEAFHEQQRPNPSIEKCLEFAYCQTAANKHLHTCLVSNQFKLSSDVIQHRGKLACGTLSMRVKRISKSLKPRNTLLEIH